MVFTWQSWMVLKLINNRATSSTLLIFCRICLSPQNFKNCLNRYSHYVLEGILKLPSRAIVDDILTVSQPEINFGHSTCVVCRCRAKNTQLKGKVKVKRLKHSEKAAILEHYCFNPWTSACEDRNNSCYQLYK